MYASPTFPFPSSAPRPRLWRVRDDLPCVPRPGDPCRLLDHRQHAGHVYFLVQFTDGEVLEYLPGDLEVESFRG